MTDPTRSAIEAAAKIHAEAGGVERLIAERDALIRERDTFKAEGRGLVAERDEESKSADRWMAAYIDEVALADALMTAGLAQCDEYRALLADRHGGTKK